ncbi:MAG: class IV adenylate cyclase, partial [bacterium]|nr:class IV adenylate cyclase [bacterium]
TGALRRKHQLLRVRQVGNRTILTFKGTPVTGKHKDREELETELANAGTFTRILNRLGMEPTFLYEKYRTEYARPDSKTGIATLDETPIGTFIELEGPPEWIDRIAAEMGFNEQDYLTASYARLYYEQAVEGSRAPAKMVFGEEA